MCLVYDKILTWNPPLRFTTFSASLPLPSMLSSSDPTFDLLFNFFFLAFSFFMGAFRFAEPPPRVLRARPFSSACNRAANSASFSSAVSATLAGLDFFAGRWADSSDEDRLTPLLTGLESWLPFIYEVSIGGEAEDDSSVGRDSALTWAAWMTSNLWPIRSLMIC